MEEGLTFSEEWMRGGVGGGMGVGIVTGTKKKKAR